MITKAIVKKLPDLNDNYYKVYIPFFRKANDSEYDSIYDATRVVISGLYDDINIDDTVYVAFEENEFDRPVIIGKLFINNEEKDITTNLVLRSLKVNDKSILNNITKINDIDFLDISRKINSLIDDTSKNSNSDPSGKIGGILYFTDTGQESNQLDDKKILSSCNLNSYLGLSVLNISAVKKCYGYETNKIKLGSSKDNGQFSIKLNKKIIKVEVDFSTWSSGEGPLMINNVSFGSSGNKDSYIKVIHTIDPSDTLTIVSKNKRSILRSLTLYVN